MADRLWDLARGFGAVIAVAVLLVVPPVALVLAVGWPLPTSLPSADDLAAAARGGIDDIVIVKTLAVLGWLAWAQIALAISLEAASLLRHRPAARVPVVPAVHGAVRYLLATATLLLGSGLASGRPEAVPLTQLTSHHVAVTLEPTLAPGPASGLGAAAGPPQAAQTMEEKDAPRYLVRRHDSWWGIAETVLGDGRRWQELRDRNVGRVMGDGHRIDADTETIHTGWTLLLPDDANPDVLMPDPGMGPGTEGSTTEVTVEPGDHFWGIAAAQLADHNGRPAEPAEIQPYWEVLIEANRDRLADPANPDLIHPGQQLAVPAISTTGPPITAEPTGPEPTGPEPFDGQAGLSPPEEAASNDVPGAATGPQVVVGAGDAEDEQTAARDEAGPGGAGRSATPGGSGPRDQVLDGDGQGLRVPGMLGVAGTLLATGLAAGVYRRRRRRLADMPAGTAPAHPPGELDELRAELVLSADDQRIRCLDQALRHAAGHLAQRKSAARLRLVQVGPEQIEVLLSEPTVPSPEGWRPEASGSIWVYEKQEPPEVDIGQSVAPALVSLGSQDGTDLLIDLEAEGLVSITGAAEEVAGLLRSIVTELAATPLDVAPHVFVVGATDWSLTSEIDTLQSFDAWEDIADDVLAWAHGSRQLLAANRWENPMTARTNGDVPDRLDPLIVVVDQQPDDERFTALCQLIGEVPVPVTVLAAGVELEGSTKLHVGEGQLHIASLGLTIPAQAVDESVILGVDQLMADSGGEAGQLSLIPTATASTDAENGAGAGGRYEDPPYEVLVRLLGKIEVVGGHKALTAKQTAVVAYIALHAPVDGGRVGDAVWAGPTANRAKSLANTVSECRAALGARHLPMATDGLYRTAATVRTDLELFERRLDYAATQPEAAAIETLHGALDLVNGPAFTYRDRDKASFVWVDLENWISTWELKVSDTAEDLARLCLGQADFNGAIWAARKGLEFSPAHTRLTKLLIAAYDGRGDQNASKQVYGSYVAALAALGIDEIDPELVERFVRHGQTGDG